MRTERPSARAAPSAGPATTLAGSARPPPDRLPEPSAVLPGTCSASKIKTLPGLGWLNFVSVKPRRARYAVFLDEIGPGRLDDCWSWRGPSD